MKRQDRKNNVNLNRVCNKVFWWGIPAALFFISSCTTERKAVSYFDHNSFVASEYCSSRFPVDSVGYHPGKEIITNYDTIIQPGAQIRCPDSQHTIIHCPAIRTLFIRTHSTDTVVIRDKAAEKALIGQNSTLNDQKVKLSVKLQEAETGRGNWRKRTLWTWGILAAFFSGFVAFKFFKPKII